ncbi:MAG: DegT/DnrJ/EryC1/StrS family aminotransferase [Candidatus Binatia bacterium]|nr:DegT/DnrJ/EryC1/StrS family aminotransferase [Candidatus Binatia bacterium]
MKKSYRWPLVAAPWTEAELHAALDPVIDSGNLTMGERVKEFEAKFARLVGSKHAVMANSGSSANLLAVASLVAFDPCLQSGQGLEAIVPAVAWSTTYAPLAQYGFKLRIVDIDPVTLSIDLAQVERALNSKTRIIVAASILGFPANLVDLRDFARSHKTYLMEDNCESLGAMIGVKQCGTFGNVGTFSMFYSHHMSTIEGGMLVTMSDEVADCALAIRAHGWTRELGRGSRLRSGSPDSFNGAYEFVLPGYNLRPTELQAALGLAQLDGLAAAQSWRTKNYQMFCRHFLNHLHFDIQKSEWGEAVPFGFVLIAESSEHRAKAFAAMDEAGIEYRMVTGGCITRHPVIRLYDHALMPRSDLESLRHANRVHDCGFFVGNHTHDLSAEIELLYKTLTWRT